MALKGAASNVCFGILEVTPPWGLNPLVFAFLSCGVMYGTIALPLGVAVSSLLSESL